MCKDLAATDPADLVDPASKKETPGITREQAGRMKTEMANLQKNSRLIESFLGPDHLRLVVAGRYAERLLQNDRLARYLDKNHGEILGGFRQIVAGLAQPVSSTEAGSNKVAWSFGQLAVDDEGPDPISAAVGMVANPLGARQGRRT